MNEALINLYELQRVDSQLDELRASRGELPERVDEIRRARDTQKQELETSRSRIAELELRVRQMNEESLELREKTEKYKAQQFDVKTTREYDAITFQLEDSTKRLNRNIEDAARMGIELEQTRSEESMFATQMDELEKELTEAEGSLTELLGETREEEEKLLGRRAELMKVVTPYYLSIYNRVRPAKNGVAVVPVRNGVCGGCFNAIPRQTVLELKRGDRHTVCEYCGRIVVGEPIAIAVDGEPAPVVESSGDEEEGGE